MQSNPLKSLTPLLADTNLRKIQQELRVSKKAEQLAKDKLTQTKKMLDKSEKDLFKFREESDARIEGLKTEISVLQKHYDQLQTSAGEVEADRSNSGEKQYSELMKIIDDYSKSTELKSKEIEGLEVSLTQKSGKVDTLKRQKKELDAKVVKLQMTLDNMKTFLKLLNTNFIKSIKNDNQKLRGEVVNQSEFLEIFTKKCKDDMETRIKQKVESMLKEVKRVNEGLQREIEAKEQALTRQTQSQESSIQKAISDYEVAKGEQTKALEAKLLKLKSKIAQLKQFG